MNGFYRERKSTPTVGATLRALGATALLIVGVAGLLLAGYFAYLLRPLARQADTPEQTHGLVFPASAVVLNHKVDPAVVRLDAHATTRLELPAADLPHFLAQLRVRQASPQQTGWQASGPAWMQTRYECASPSGDILWIDVSDAGQPTVTVEINTNWN